MRKINEMFFHKGIGVGIELAKRAMSGANYDEEYIREEFDKVLEDIKQIRRKIENE